MTCKDCERRERRDNQVTVFCGMSIIVYWVLQTLGIETVGKGIIGLSPFILGFIVTWIIMRKAV